MASRIAEIETRRAAERARLARERVLGLLDAVEREPVDIALIGSLAADRFGPHSDVDLLVRGPVDATTRVRVEQLVAGALRGTGLPYDLIFAADLTPDRLREFEHDLVEPSRLREAWAEAASHAKGARQSR